MPSTTQFTMFLFIHCAVPLTYRSPTRGTSAAPRRGIISAMPEARERHASRRRSSSSMKVSRHVQICVASSWESTSAWSGLGDKLRLRKWPQSTRSDRTNRKSIRRRQWPASTSGACSALSSSHRKQSIARGSSSNPSTNVLRASFRGSQMGLAQMGLADYSPEGSKKDQKQIRELTDAGDKQTTLREAEIRQTGGAALVFVLVMRAPLGNVMICCVFSPRRVWGKSATNHHIP